jgi:acyl-CoA synthetase (AMP-forming)/AMP-acid ligase II/thioesterase domain-containing protein
MPQAVALLSPGREPLTYLGLWSVLGSVGEALRAAGLRPAEAVALLTRPGPEFVTSFLAISEEFTCAPLDPSLTASEYRFYLSRLGARNLVIEDGVALPAVAAARELGICVRRIRPARDRAAGAFTLDTAEGDATARPGRQTDAALLLHTSATTGNPKLVPLTSANLLAVAVQDSRAEQLSQQDRLLSMAPLFHSIGFAPVLAQLFSGGSVVCAPGFEAASFPAWLEEFHPTWLAGAPPMLNAILGLALRHPELFDRLPLRFIRSSGAPLESKLRRVLEDAVRAPVLEGYGLTEAVGLTRSTTKARKPGSVGRSTGARIAITDGTGRLLPPETEGEIVARGPSVTSGYVDDPEANRLAFRDGWFRTGDVGRLDGEGFLYVTGRLKEMINRGGQKILPREVDEVLARHPAVAEAVAFGVPHRTLGEDVAAAVVLREGASVSEPDLRRFAAADLAAFKVPFRIAFVDRIPRGATGKLRRSTLAEQFRDSTGGRVPPKPSLTPMERRLIEIWSRILETSEIGVEDNFFALGGDSLSAALMLTEVQGALKAGAAFDRIDFFDQPTIASLARILAEYGARFDHYRPGRTRQSRILTFQEGGARSPFFCFAANALDPYYLRHLSRGLGSEQPFHVVGPPAPVDGQRLLKVDELARLSLSAIRTIQPRGPYLLGGHCYGGVIAFETARQLQSEGEQIARLVLFDVPVPGYPKVGRSWARYLKEGRRLLAGLARGELETGREAVRHFRWLRRILARRFGGRAGRALSLLGSGALVAGRGEGDVNAMVLAGYVPAPFAAPIVHFIAADEAVTTRVLEDPRLGWREFAHGGLELRMVSGDHNSLFAAGHARALAAQLEPLLQTGAESLARGECSV